MKDGKNVDPGEEVVGRIVFRHEVEFTRNDVDCVMAGARNACSYWCEAWDVPREDFGKVQFIEDVVGAGLTLNIRIREEYDGETEDRAAGAMRITDREGENVEFICLNLERFMAGLQSYCDARPKRAAAYAEDPSNWDAEDYDCVVQLALFREVVYV